MSRIARVAARRGAMTGGEPVAAATGVPVVAAGAAGGRALRAASVLVALAGLGIAGYLTAVHYADAEPVCAVSHGCATVQQSEYAELAGVPVALLGLIGYVAILGSLARDGEAWRTATAFLALSGFAFSAWLTYVEVVKLDAICIWCVGSAVCMAVLAALATARLLMSPPPERSGAR